MSIAIKPLVANREDAWDRFVREDPKSTFFAQIGWKRVVEEVYRHRPLYLFAEDESGEMAGVFPLFQVRAAFSGVKFVSVPYAPYGGIYCRGGSVQDAFLEELRGMVESGAGGSAEIRHVGGGPPPAGFSSRNGYCTSILDLSPGADPIQKNMDKTCRTAIRKGERSNLTCTFSSDAASVSRFYTMYLETMKRLGTPPHSPDLFLAILKHFKTDILVAEAYHGDTAVASLFLLGFRETLISGWAVSRWEYREFAPNNYIYWHAILEALARGYRYFDFGRSWRNSGIHAFKKRWNVQDVPLRYWSYPAFTGGSIPQEEYGQLAKIWSRVPLGIARILGPRIRRSII